MKSVKLKMMIMCSLLCFVIILALFICTSTLLEPVYHYFLQQEMQTKLTEAENLLLQNDLLSKSNKLNADTIDKLKALLSEGNCLDISHTDILSDNFQHKAIVFLEGLGNCELHNQKSFASSAPSDSEVASLFRLIVTQKGGINQLSPKGGQWMWGKVMDNGYILILSSGVTRVEQISIVIEKLLLGLSIILIPLSLIISFVFASWFTNPLRRLSRATHQMAQGKYDVSLPVTTKDEIGRLTQDFNHMAYEVNKSDQLQKELISSISHDLRTPLTLVKGYAETIRDLTGENKNKRNLQLNIIIDETDRLSALVGSVLQLGKLASGVQKPKQIKFDVCQLIEEIIIKYQDKAEKTACDLGFDRSDENPRYIIADPDLIGRVLHNLISNAFNHIGADNLLIVKTTDIANGVCVEVIDHGEGIPADECTKIFDRYYRARQDNGKQGTGLGLSIVKAILQAHSFGFGVKSKKGEGASFWFTAPMYTPPIPHQKQKNK